MCCGFEIQEEGKVFAAMRERRHCTCWKSSRLRRQTSGTRVWLGREQGRDMNDGIWRAACVSWLWISIHKWEVRVYKVVRVLQWGKRWGGCSRETRETEPHAHTRSRYHTRARVSLVHRVRRVYRIWTRLQADEPAMEINTVFPLGSSFLHFQLHNLTHCTQPPSLSHARRWTLSCEYDRLQTFDTFIWRTK